MKRRWEFNNKSGKNTGKEEIKSSSFFAAKIIYHRKPKNLEGKKPLEINDRIWQDGQIEYRYAKSGAFF